MILPWTLACQRIEYNWTMSYLSEGVSTNPRFDRTSCMPALNEEWPDFATTCGKIWTFYLDELKPKLWKFGQACSAVCPLGVECQQSQESKMNGHLAVSSSFAISLLVDWSNSLRQFHKPTISGLTPKRNHVTCRITFWLIFLRATYHCSYKIAEFALEYHSSKNESWTKTCHGYGPCKENFSYANVLITHASFGF